MMSFSGVLKAGGAYQVNGKDGSQKIMISFTAVDELGNAYPCQMWPDDPQHAQLASLIENMRRQPVQFTISSYTVRMRKFKDGSERPQVNFIVTDVAFPAAQ